METFTIYKEELQSLIDESIKRIKSWRYYTNFQGYVDEYPDHTFGFCRFSPKETGLDVTILVDDSATYYLDNHPLFIYFYNNLTEEKYDELVPIAVHQFCPFILDSNAKINIPKDSLDRIFHFIKTNYFFIKEYSSGRIDYDAFKLLAIKRYHSGVYDPFININDIKEDGLQLSKHEYNSIIEDLKRCDDKKLTIKFSVIGSYIIIAPDLKNRYGKLFTKLLSSIKPFKSRDGKYIFTHILSLYGNEKECANIIYSVIDYVAMKLKVKTTFIDTDSIESLYIYCKQNNFLPRYKNRNGQKHYYVWKVKDLYRIKLLFNQTKKSSYGRK